jgi:hypothetical protein
MRHGWANRTPTHSLELTEPRQVRERREGEETRLEHLIGRAAAALGHSPVDEFLGGLDGAALAVHTGRMCVCVCVCVCVMAGVLSKEERTQ